MAARVNDRKLKELARLAVVMTGDVVDQHGIR